MSDKQVIGMAAADIHLGFRQYGLAERAEDFYKAFESVVDETIKARAKFLILAGDILHSLYPHARSVQVLKEQCGRLHDVNIEILAITGNHDSVNPSWCDLVEARPLDGKIIDVEGVKISGMNYCPEDEARARLAKIPDVDIFVMHQAFQEFIGFKSASALSITNLNPKVPLYVIGDIHVDNWIHWNEKSVAGYPGSTELNSKAEPKSKTIVKLICENRKVRTELVKIPTRPVLQYDVLSEEDLNDVAGKIRKYHDKAREMPDLLSRYGGKPLVFVNYGADVPGAVPRLTSLAGQICLLRMDPIATNEAAPVNLAGAADIVSIRDVLANFAGPSTPEFATTMRLLETPEQREKIVNDMIDSIGVKR